MANDEIKFLPIFQILDIKNIWFLLELEMALATTIKKKFELVCDSLKKNYLIFPTNFKMEFLILFHCKKDKCWTMDISNSTYVHIEAQIFATTRLTNFDN